MDNYKAVVCVPSARSLWNVFFPSLSSSRFFMWVSGTCHEQKCREHRHDGYLSGRFLACFVDKPIAVHSPEPPTQVKWRFRADHATTAVRAVSDRHQITRPISAGCGFSMSSRAYVFFRVTNADRTHAVNTTVLCVFVCVRVSSSGSPNVGS